MMLFEIERHCFFHQRSEHRSPTQELVGRKSDNDNSSKLFKNQSFFLSCWVVFTLHVHQLKAPSWLDAHISASAPLFS